MAKKQYIRLLFIRRNLIEFCRNICQRDPHRADVRSTGANHQPKPGMSRSLQLQRHIQRSPRCQGLPPRGESCLVPLQAADLAQRPANLLADRLCLLLACRVQEFLF